MRYQCPDPRRPDWVGAAPGERVSLDAASAGSRSSHSVRAPSAAARLSLDGPPSCPYVILVLPLCLGYLTRPITPFFPPLL